MKRIIYEIKILVDLFGFIQLFPFERNHTNPAVTSEPKCNNPATRELVKKVYSVCHVNATA